VGTEFGLHLDSTEALRRHRNRAKSLKKCGGQGRNCTALHTAFETTLGSLSRPKIGRMEAMRMSEETPRAMTLWHRTITRFAARLRENYGPIDRATAQRIARILASSLVARRPSGRKPTPPVLTALELLEQGIPWVRVYPRAIPNFQELPWYLQNVRKHNLRRAVYACRWRRRRRLLQSNFKTRPCGQDPVTTPTSSKTGERLKLRSRDRVVIHAMEVDEKLVAHSVEVGATTPTKQTAKH